jgi:UDP-N-acetylglucosamine:LPS N-acetylglucosamine transferase
MAKLLLTSTNYKSFFWRKVVTVNKKILVISSDYTGHGHKSIAESLQEQIGDNEQTEIHVVDGFALGGSALLNIGKSYGPITRNSAQLWNAIWHLSAMNSYVIDKGVENLIKDDFMALLDEVKPDVILSIHPNFNGSVINILRKERIHIPFGTLIADLVNIYPLWCDPRADFILSPTKEAKGKCLEYGVPKERIHVVGFPVRQRFLKSQRKPFEMKSELNFLIMSGGEGVGDMNAIAENLLRDFNCTVTIIAGRNETLKAELESSLKARFDNRVDVIGFTKDIQDLMLAADIGIMRGSPNTMFEAVATNLPIIITGALPGQEKDNPLFVEKHHLGVYCQDNENLKLIIDQLLENDGQKLKMIMESQRTFFNPQAAQDILNYLTSAEKAKWKSKKRRRTPPLIRATRKSYKKFKRRKPFNKLIRRVG